MFVVLKEGLLEGKEIRHQQSSLSNGLLRAEPDRVKQSARAAGKTLARSPGSAQNLNGNTTHAGPLGSTPPVARKPKLSASAGVAVRRSHSKLSCEQYLKFSYIFLLSLMKVSFFRYKKHQNKDFKILTQMPLKLNKS